MLKVLNLYAGIGGNRKLWEGVEVTAVELAPGIADVYKKFFPGDTVVVGDAHQFLLKNFKEFDFIWSSPPCPTHSVIRNNVGVHNNTPRGGHAKPAYPDMRLYQEVILLTHHCKTRWAVENVVSYYRPLIAPQKVGRHYVWANFPIGRLPIKPAGLEHAHIADLEKRFGFDLSDYKNPSSRERRFRELEKDRLLRNCVEPQLGLHVLNCAFEGGKNNA